MTRTTIGRVKFNVEKLLSECTKRLQIGFSVTEKSRGANGRTAKVKSWTSVIFVIYLARVWQNVSGNTNSGSTEGKNASHH